MTDRDAAQDVHAAAIDAASRHGDAVPTGDLQQAALSFDAAIELPLPGEIAVLRVQPGQVLAFDFALAGLIREWAAGDLLLRAADGTSGEVRLSGFLDQAFGEHPVVVSFAGEPIELAQLLADGVSPEAMIEPAAGGSGGGSAPEGGASFTPFVDQSPFDDENRSDTGRPNPLTGTELDLGQEDEEQDAPANKAFMAFSSGGNDNNAVTPDLTASAPSLSTADATGSEDHAIPLDLAAGLTDLDGSETLAVTISGLPTGASLSAGTDNHDRTWSLTADQLVGLTLTPPADFSGPIHLTIAATVTESASADGATTTANFSVIVEAIADAPTVQAANASGSEDNSIPLDLSAALTDLDGSETLAVAISGLPTGASLSAGTDNHDGTWRLTADQLAGLSLTPPADFSGTIDLSISATSAEGSNADAATTTADFSVTVESVADAPTVQAANVSGSEDHSIPLDLSVALADTDGSESLAVTILGVPTGAMLSAGTKNPDGSWSVTGDQLSGLNLKPPVNFSGNINLSLSATATEGANGNAATTTTGILVHVAPVADAPDLSAIAAFQSAPGGNGTVVSTNIGGSQKDALAGGIGGDKLVGNSSDDLIIGDYGSGPITVELNIAAAVTDADGSETIELTISGVPNGASLSAGANLGGGAWLLQPAQLSGLTLSVPSGTPDFTLAVTATVTDKFGSELDTLDQTMNVIIPTASDSPGGNDDIRGGSGADTLLGGAGADTLNGESGHDLLRGEAGNDQMIGGSGSDTLEGGLGSDSATGGAGGDQLYGGDGADTLDGGASSDLLEGGAGADVLIGGAGIDTASYAQSTAGVTIDLSTGTGSGGDAQGDALSTIENLVGSGHADRLTGNSSNNDLYGGAGGDLLTGGAGVDDLFGDGGNDRLVWDTQDKFDGGSGFDIIDARSSAGGTIDLRNATNLEAVVTGGANDTVRISLSDVLIDTADNQFFAVLGGGTDRLRIDTSGGWTAVATTATPGPESAGADLGVDLSNLAVHSFTNGTSTVSVFTDAEVVTS